MTLEQLQKIPFHFVSSLSMEDEHMHSYESEDGRLGYCDHTPKRKNGDFGRTYRHWRIDNKVYKKKEKFIEALNDFNPAVVNINYKPYQNTVARMKHERDAKPSATVVDMLPSKFTQKGKYSETTYSIHIRKYALTEDVDLYQIAYGNYKFYEDGSSSWKDMINTGEKENLIDAVFQMICWLKENKKL